MSRLTILLACLALIVASPAGSSNIQDANMDPGSGGFWWHNTFVPCGNGRTWWYGYAYPGGPILWIPCAIDPRYGLW